MANPVSAQEQTDKLNAREKALAEKEAALERDLKKFNVIRSKLEFDATDVKSGSALNIGEIGQGKGVEMVTESFNKEQAAFAEELLLINVYPDGMPGSLDVIVVTVNGINQPIIRGRDQLIKRKYVEALARSRITSYMQEVNDPSRPENIQMKPIAALTYPFTVREDRNPKGRAWLESILNQPV
jgi:hypothetical protein